MSGRSRGRCQRLCFRETPSEYPWSFDEIPLKKERILDPLNDEAFKQQQAQQSKYETLT